MLTLWQQSPSQPLITIISNAYSKPFKNLNGLFWILLSGTAAIATSTKTNIPFYIFHSNTYMILDKLNNILFTFYLFVFQLYPIFLSNAQVNVHIFFSSSFSPK